MSTPRISYQIGEADERVLRAINRFGYLTAAQVGRLLYPRSSDHNRYSQRRLRALAEAGLLLRLRELPTPRYGSAPLVFTLARRGRQLLSARGVPVPSYFRPSEQQEKAGNLPFIEHTLETIDVLIAAHRLSSDVPGVALTRMLVERELKAMAIPVRVPAASRGTRSERTTVVIPDAWFQIDVGEAEPYSVALELDRGTVEQKRWRSKVAALCVWATGPYRETFHVENLTIAVVVPSVARREELQAWTRRELSEGDLSDLAEYFLFTDASCTKLSPQEFFFGPLWHLPEGGEPVVLINPPVRPFREGREEVVFVS